MASSPIERSDSITGKSTLLMQHYNQQEPEQESEQEPEQESEQEPEQELEPEPVVTFYCDFHKKVFKLTSQSINQHFKAHEEEILLLSDYEKVGSSRLINVYEKSFDDDASVMDPFEQENLRDIVDLVRVGGSMKERAKIIISFK